VGGPVREHQGVVPHDIQVALTAIAALDQDDAALTDLAAGVRARAL